MGGDTRFKARVVRGQRKAGEERRESAIRLKAKKTKGIEETLRFMELQNDDINLRDDNVTFQTV